jgi:predicted O-methyltransferase YrrM
MFRKLIAEIGRSLRGRVSSPFAARYRDESGSPEALAGEARKPPVSGQLNFVSAAWQAAASQAADYMVQHMMSAVDLVERDRLLEFTLDKCSIPGLMMEFGVYRGASLRLIAQRAGQLVHGFDSFEGLPEDWTYFQKQGRFGLASGAPSLPEANVEIHTGWFDAVLPEFLKSHPGPARFVHIDCDLYSSTRTVLALLASRLVSGTVVQFDEYLNYPGWDQHEYKAFQEYVRGAGARYRYLGFASSGSAVAVQIL